MKVKILLTTLLSLGLTASLATPRPVAAAVKKRMSKTMYVCPKCGATSDKRGDCAKCKVPMEEAKFTCPKCKVYTTMDGKCPKCGAALKPVDSPLAAPRKK